MDENRGRGHEGRASIVVGVVGGIGSGKSQVTRLLAEAGAEVVSGDALGHEALRQPEVREQVVRRWGAGVLGPDGEIDRKKLGGIVFAEPSQLRELEALVHPWIKRRIREEVDAARARGVPLVVLDAAIMLEAGWEGACDEVLFVDVPRALRLERLARQGGWTEKEVEARERAQWPLEEKARRADLVLDNSGTLDGLRQQVGALLRRWVVPRRP